MSVVTATSWTRKRLQTAGVDIDPICPRCGQAEETEFHRYWECPANGCIDQLQSQPSLERRAAANADGNPALWLRGIPPSTWIKTPPPSDEPVIARFGQFPVAAAPAPCSGPTYGFGDASGGKHTSDPRRRRVGWSMVILNTSKGIVPSPDTVCSWSPVAGCQGPLPGRTQTVNRGEAWAFKVFLESTSGSVAFITDSSYVVRGFNKLLAHKMPKSNGDIWTSIRRLIQNRKVFLGKVESHLTPQEVAAGATHPLWFMGNAIADNMASDAAEAAQINQGVSASIDLGDALVASITKRLA